MNFIKPSQLRMLVPPQEVDITIISFYFCDDTRILARLSYSCIIVTQKILFTNELPPLPMIYGTTSTPMDVLHDITYLPVLQQKPKSAILCSRRDVIFERYTWYWFSRLRFDLLVGDPSVGREIGSVGLSRIERL